jgi:hypothetical protein
VGAVAHRSVLSFSSVSCSELLVGASAPQQPRDRGETSGFIDHFDQRPPAGYQPTWSGRDSHFRRSEYPTEAPVFRIPIVPNDGNGPHAMGPARTWTGVPHNASALCTALRAAQSALTIRLNHPYAAPSSSMMSSNLFWTQAQKAGGIVVEDVPLLLH